jgi:hypothetical protein
LTAHADADAGQYIMSFQVQFVLEKKAVRRDVAVGIGVVAAGADASLANLIQVEPVVGVLSSGVVRDSHDVACADGASNG